MSWRLKYSNSNIFCADPPRQGSCRARVLSKRLNGMRENLNFASSAEAAGFLRIYNSRSWSTGQPLCRTGVLAQNLKHGCTSVLCKAGPSRTPHGNDNPVRKNLPRVYPVTTESSSGLGFVVSPGFVVTCEHVVVRKELVLVAGASATIVSACPADTALLYVPALSKKPVREFHVDLNNQFVQETFQSHRILVVGPRRNAILTAVGSTCMMLYKSSGAYLPSLSVDLMDATRKEQNVVEHGWSGAPIICNDSGKVVGMVAHGGLEISGRDGFYAVPGRIIEWFLSRCVAVDVTAPTPRWIPMGAIAHVAAQALTSKASRLAAELLIVNRALLPPGIGIRVARVNPHTGLRVNDIILKVNGLDVYSDGTVLWMGMRFGYQTAFLELQPGLRSGVQVIRRGISGGGEVLDILAAIDSTERSTLGIPVQSRGIALEAGNGAVRLVELSIDLLERWYGASWQAECDLDLRRAAIGDLEYSGNAPPGQAHIVVDPSSFGGNFNSARAGSNCDAGDDWGWNEMKGMRVCRVNGKKVHKLEDIMSISDNQSTSAPLIIELYPGYCAAMPMPLRIVDNRNEQSEIG